VEKIKTTFSVLFVVSFCHFLTDTIQSMLPAIYPLLKSEFRLSFAQIGMITLVVQITSSVVQPLIGVYADKHHHSWQLSVGMLFTLAGIALLSNANGYGVILVAVSLFGCGSAIFHPQGSQVAQLASGGRKGLAQGVFQVGGTAGFSFGPLLAGLIVLPYGLFAIRWFGVLAVVCAGLLFYVGKWHVRELGRASQKVRERWTLAERYSRRKIYFFVGILFVLMFSKNFYSSSMTNYFTFFLIDKFGVSVRTAQICLFVFLASQAVGTIVGGLIGDRFGRKIVIWFSILGAAPFTMFLPYLHGFAATVLLSVVIGLIISSAFSAILVFATDLMPNHTGIVAGLFYGLSFGIAGIGSSFFGWLADRTSVGFVFQVSTLLPFIGIVAAFLPKMKRA
jgi:MFS transporter, FSR family, fosmidomycin resistance protein